MALPTNKIGDFYFLALNGVIVPPAEVLSLDERPGVDGTEFTKEGVKGRPFQLLSYVDADDYAAARALAVNYLTMIQTDPVEIVQGGVSTLDGAYRVKVLNVQAEARAIGGGVGSVNPNARGLVQALWDLISVPM